MLSDNFQDQIFKRNFYDRLTELEQKLFLISEVYTISSVQLNDINKREICEWLGISLSEFENIFLSIGNHLLEFEEEFEDPLILFDDVSRDIQNTR